MPDPRENTINYLELPVHDIAASKDFFSNLFGWKFVDYGPDYSCFHGAGIDGGFYTSAQYGFRSEGGPLIVFYYYDIDRIKAKITALSGKIIKDTYAFPGGRRFHFTDVNDNEYAIWTDKPE
ncbi:MAG: VOC family protein [Thioalkalispiraceae bacterium]|jgi:predicted enzyme related to lactoylglutathione lyase